MNHEVIHHPEPETIPDKPREDIMNLSEVFEDGLSKYYQTAVDSFASNHPNYSICHELLNINSNNFSAGQLIFYSSIFVENHKELIHSGESVITNLEPERWIDYEDYPDPDRMLLRIWVDFDCTELFYVQDNTTKEIIQGSQEPVQRKHNMLLEGSVAVGMRKPPVLITDWKIVDIDHWLEGHDKDWTRKRLK